MGQNPEPGIRQKISELETEKRVAYEVSVSKVDFLEE